jgi:acyl carrier protein
VHGKVDRKALPAPQAMARVIEPPRTDEERTVAAIFAEILGLKEVGAQDDFFDLGGHSLLGLQVVSRLRAAYGIELPLRSLFEASTVAALAELVKVAQWVMVGAPAAGAAGDEVEEGFL